MTYRAMNNSDNIVLLLETDGIGSETSSIVIDANATFFRVSGFAEEEIIGRLVTDLFPVKEEATPLITAMRDTGVLRTEYKCLQVSGRSFILGFHLMPAPARTAARPCFVILGRDITDVLAARELQNSIQRMLAKVFSSVDAGVAIIDASGRVVMTNPRIDLLLGYKPNGLVGTWAQDLLGQGSRTSVAMAVKQHMEDGAQVSYAAHVLHSNGTELPVRITSVIVAPVDSKKFES